jgi:PAS domain S-box-containing protein
MEAPKDLTEALRQAALAVSTAEGEHVFEDLAGALARILGVEYAMISVYIEPGRTVLRTLANFFGGRLEKNIDYPVAGTPCESAIGRSFGYYPEGIARRFPHDRVLADHGIEGYAATTLHDVHGTPIGALTVMSRGRIDEPALTEAMLQIFAARVAAEIERRRSAASYRAIFDSAETCIFLLDDGTGAIVEANPKACAVYGYGAGEMRGLTADELGSGVPPYTGADAMRLVERARRGEVVHGEWHRRNKDGGLHWDEITLKKVEIAGVPRILAATREITQRKAAEEALRASEEQYRAIFNVSEDALVLRDADFRIVDVNPAYENVIGRKREEVLGRRDVIVGFLGTTADYLELHQRVLEGGRERLESEGVLPDGSHVHVELLMTPMQYRGAPHVLYVGRNITERRRAEMALRASEEQYRAIFNGSADGLVLRDADFRIVDVNAAYEAMSGKRRAEVVGQTNLTVSARDASAARLGLHAVALTGEPIRFETDGRRSDGAPFVLEVRGVPMTYGGRPHVLYIGRDITEAKRAEGALRASGEQYRAIFDASSDALVLRDADFRIVDVNAAYEAMSGKRRAEVIGLADLTLTKDSSVAVARQDLHAQAIAGKPLFFEADGLRPDGTPFVLEVRGQPMRYRGEPHVLYVGRDVTDSKLAERALRASEDQYRSIFNAATDSLVLRDAEFRIVDVNPAYEAMSGRARAEVLGGGEVTMSDPALAGRIKSLHARVLAGEPVQWEAGARRKSGERFDIEVRGVPIRHRGEPHVLYIGRDITGRKRAEAERAALEGQLRQAQKMETIGQLTGGIAHDFNNILQGILGNLVLAEERQAEIGDERLSRYLERARLSSQRARDLIRQMLTFSRGQRGERKPADLAALVREAGKLLRSSLPATLELRTALAEDLPSAPLDAVQIEQVLLNLCINARDAMGGEGAIEVRVAAVEHHDALCASCRQRASGRFLELAVRDTGVGIEPEVLDRMFDPFFSTKEAGKGSGMGLAMVHGIVHQHGGHVLVESSPGRGAEFRVLFGWPEAAAAAPAPAAPRARKARAQPRFAGRVLVADDELTIREFLGELLGGWGLEVVACADGAQARDAFAGDPQAFDLVITDQSMPGLTGLQLACLVQRMRPGLPVILCTGYGEALEPRELQAACVRALARKPMEPQELRELLRAALPTGNKTPT